ncbi:head maturation protease, ClpP-related [Paenibacillus psychroresistens]|nr:head maturation protease, ClpP-related [Paenibacillus psychroresistens]
MPITTKTFWNLKQTTNNSAELTIYSPIDDEESWWYDSVTPKSLMRELDAAGDVTEIVVRINSGGGSAFAGLTIYELLKNHKASITTRIDGLAASAASIIAMAGDKIVMGTGAMMMVHNPWTMAMGESKDLRHTADVLDQVAKSLISVYQDRTGLDPKDIKKLLDKETWLTADEAVSQGFADEVDRKYMVSASINDGFAVFNGQKFSLKAFAMIPNLPKASEEETETVTKEEETDSNQQQTESETPETVHENTEDESHKEEETVKDLNELQTKHPEIYKAAVQSGVDQERGRIKSLNDLVMPGNEIIIDKAKYETGASAAETAVEILKADNLKRKGMGGKILQDASNSGMNQLDTAAPEEEKTEEDKIKDTSQSLLNFIKKKRGNQ